MATIKRGICPCCGKDRELAYFQFGIVKVTMCVYCINHYLDKSVIPHLVLNNSVSINDKEAVDYIE